MAVHVVSACVARWPSVLDDELRVQLLDLMRELLLALPGAGAGMQIGATTTALLRVHCLVHSAAVEWLAPLESASNSGAFSLASVCRLAGARLRRVRRSAPRAPRPAARHGGNVVAVAAAWLCGSRRCARSPSRRRRRSFGRWCSRSCASCPAPAPSCTCASARGRCCSCCCRSTSLTPRSWRRRAALSRRSGRLCRTR
jgi:hypothetical protein